MTDEGDDAADADVDDALGERRARREDGGDTGAGPDGESVGASADDEGSETSGSTGNDGLGVEDGAGDGSAEVRGPNAVEGDDGESTVAGDAEESTGALDADGSGVTATPEESNDAVEAEEGTNEEVLEVAVPPNLRSAWQHQAEQATLSLSEYVVRMTEAGRMSVQMQPALGGGDAGAAMSADQLREEVVEELRHEEAVDWEGLVDAISRNLEERLEEVLEDLQEDDVVRYSGLRGGYHLVEED